MTGKTMLLVALAVVAMLATGCKKDDPIENGTGTETETPAVDRQELILGLWDVVLDKSYEQYTEPGYAETTLCSDWADRITLNFKSDTILTYTSAAGGENGWVDSWDDAYSFDGDTVKWGKWNYYVSVLDSTRLVMESIIQEDHPRRNGTVLHTAEIKHYEMVRIAGE